MLICVTACGREIKIEPFNLCSLHAALNQWSSSETFVSIYPTAEIHRLPIYTCVDIYGHVQKYAYVYIYIHMERYVYICIHRICNKYQRTRRQLYISIYTHIWQTCTYAVPYNVILVGMYAVLYMYLQTP